MHIERIDHDGEREGPLTPDELYRSLIYAGFYVKGVAQIGAQWATRQSQWPNVFTDEAELPETDKFKDPQIKWHQAYFDLGDDEALVRRVQPAGVRILDDRPPQPLDGDAGLRPRPVHTELPLGPPRTRRDRPLRRRRSAIPACPTGSTRPGTDAAPLACVGWDPMSSTCCRRPGSSRCRRCDHVRAASHSCLEWSAHGESRSHFGR